MDKETGGRERKTEDLKREGGGEAGGSGRGLMASTGALGEKEREGRRFPCGPVRPSLSAGRSVTGTGGFCRRPVILFYFILNLFLKVLQGRISIF